MSGNVFEWCWDGYDPNSYQQGERVDPKGYIEGNTKVRRGGSWYRQRVDMGVVRRFHAPSTEKTAEQGFRLCRLAHPSNK